MRRNAVIMAAGMSTRFVPLSVERPKALLRVKGEVLIERQIRQLREAGIDEIIVVTGYKKEQFDYLAGTYKVLLIENPFYQSKNNHSTLYAARQYLRDTFICSGDNYFTENVFLKESPYPYYAAVYADGATDEWCMSTDEKDRIRQVEIGGHDAWIMKGHAYFTRDFSDRFVPYLEKAYRDAGSSEKFWEEIYMEHIEEFDLYIRRYGGDIIHEFDSLEELREFDETYADHTGSVILEDISRELDCMEREITGIRPVKEQGCAIGFRFECRGQTYIYDFKIKRLQEEK